MALFRKDGLSFLNMMAKFQIPDIEWKGLICCHWEMPFLIEYISEEENSFTSVSFNFTTKNYRNSFYYHGRRNNSILFQFNHNSIKMDAHGMRPMRFLSARVWFPDVTCFFDTSGMVCSRAGICFYIDASDSLLWLTFTLTQTITDASEKDVTSRNQWHAPKKRTGRMPCASSFRLQ